VNQQRLLMVLLLLLSALVLAACQQRQDPPDTPDIPDFQSTLESEITPWTAEPQSDPATIRFAVIGDRTGLARPGVFEQAMLQVSWMQPEFVISVGDLVEGYSDDRAVLAQEWDEIEQAVDKAGLPFFYVAGNHDLGTDAQLALWRERKGQTWYSFVYKNALFLILDTEDPPVPMPAERAAQFREVVGHMKTDPETTEAMVTRAAVAETAQRQAQAGDNLIEQARFSPAQVQWAKQELARYPDVRWTFVLLHKPAWILDSAEFSEIEAALQERPYTVIAGHFHYYRHERRHGRDYITMGTTGGISHGEGKGRMDHIAWVTLADKAPKFALIKLNGLLDIDAESGQIRAR